MMLPCEQQDEERGKDLERRGLSRGEPEKPGH